MENPQFDSISFGDPNAASIDFNKDVLGILSSFQFATRFDPTAASDWFTSPGFGLCIYGSDAHVLKDYYRLIHPAFPILPPPMENSYQESVEWLSPEVMTSGYEPSSPLVLALLSLLVLMPQKGKRPAADAGAAELNASLATFLANKATGLLQVCADNQSSYGASSLHPKLPVEYEKPLAYCVLSLYQYVHCGNTIMMRRLADKAFDACLALRLHELEEDGSEYCEARNRTWWMTYMCICHASVISCRPPSRILNMPKVKVPYPTSRCHPEVWVCYIQAVETLVAATLLLLTPTEELNSSDHMPSFRRNIDALDKLIRFQLDSVESLSPSYKISLASDELNVFVHFRAAAKISLLCALMKIQRYRTLSDYPETLRTFEAIPSIIISRTLFNASTPPEADGAGRATRMFPFTSQYDLQCYLASISHAAGVVGNLATHDICISTTVAYSAVLTGYMSMMILYFHKSTSTHDFVCLGESKLDEECRIALRIAISALGRLSWNFAFINQLRNRLRRVAVACDISIPSL